MMLKSWQEDEAEQSIEMSSVSIIKIRIGDCCSIMVSPASLALAVDSSPMWLRQSADSYFVFQRSFIEVFVNRIVLNHQFNFRFMRGLEILSFELSEVSLWISWLKIK